MKVGINGFGRMGRLSARVLIEKGEAMGLDLVHVNEKVGGADMAAYLLEFDSTHGRFSHSCTGEKDGDHLLVDGNKKIVYTRATTADSVDWQSTNVEIVLECTGAILTPELLEGHFKQGCVKKVVVSAPVDKGDILNVVMGCNDSLITPDMRIVTAASCTTNCAAPLIGALDSLGIEMGTITTVHDVTPTQTITDFPNPGKKNDLRRARSGAVNMSPTSTGSAKAVAMIYPHLKGKLDGMAVRVPCQNASITDLVLVTKRDTTKEEVNTLLKQASEANPTVLGFELRPLVSTDYVNDSRSSIVDASCTQVVNKRLVKIYSWYDNEWGYVNRMVEIAKVMKDNIKTEPHNKRARI